MANDSSGSCLQASLTWNFCWDVKCSAHSEIFRHEKDCGYVVAGTNWCLTGQVLIALFL